MLAGFVDHVNFCVCVFKKEKMSNVRPIFYFVSVHGSFRLGCNRSWFGSFGSFWSSEFQIEHPEVFLKRSLPTPMSHILAGSVRSNDVTFVLVPVVRAWTAKLHFGFLNLCRLRWTYSKTFLNRLTMGQTISGLVRQVVGFWS